MNEDEQSPNTAARIPEQVDEAVDLWQMTDSGDPVESLNEIFGAAAETRFRGVFVIACNDGRPVWVEVRQWDQVIESLPNDRLRMRCSVMPLVGWCAAGAYRCALFRCAVS